jgi:hypothetical protein
VHGLKTEVPEVHVATLDVSPVIAVVTKKEKGSINGIALANELQKHFDWTLAKTQRPPGFHIAITDANADRCKDFVKQVKACVQMIKEKPELNTNSEVASYGMAANMPSDFLLHGILISIMNSVLDAL